MSKENSRKPVMKEPLTTTSVALRSIGSAVNLPNTLFRVREGGLVLRRWDADDIT
jgi:hypothetical protein